VSQGAEKIPHDSEIRAVIDRAQKQSALALTRLEQIQSEIAAVMPPVGIVGIHAEMDTVGHLTELTIDPDAVAGLSPDDIAGGITLAMGQAAGRRPALGLDDIRRFAGDLDLREVLDRIFSGNVDHDSQPLWNEERTVGVVIDTRMPRRVVLEPRWAGSVHPAALAEQVLRTVNLLVDREGGVER
jgi:hypothetical protein